MCIIERYVQEATCEWQDPTRRRPDLRLTLKQRKGGREVQADQEAVQLLGVTWHFIQKATDPVDRLRCQ
ncbi:unnamed protein product, partial [Cyprideis torosa]